MSHWESIWLRKSVHLFHIKQRDSAVCRTLWSKILSPKDPRAISIYSYNKQGRWAGRKVIGFKGYLLLSWPMSLNPKLLDSFFPEIDLTHSIFRRQLWWFEKQTTESPPDADSQYQRKLVLRFHFTHQLCSAALCPFCALLQHTAGFFPHPSFLQSEPAEMSKAGTQSKGFHTLNTPMRSVYYVNF